MGSGDDSSDSPSGMARFLAFAAAAAPPAAILVLHYKLKWFNAAIIVFLVTMMVNQSIAIQCLRTSDGGKKSTNFFFSIGSLIATLLAMSFVVLNSKEVKQRLGDPREAAMNLSQRLRQSIQRPATTTPAPAPTA